MISGDQEGYRDFYWGRSLISPVCTENLIRVELVMESLLAVMLALFLTRAISSCAYFLSPEPPQPLSSVVYR